MKKYIVITGASSGIGAATAKAFARRGENLIVIARRAELLENLKDEIANISPDSDVIVKPCDLSRTENVLALWNDLRSYELKALINNAGFGDFGFMGNHDIQKMVKMIDLNVTALAILSSLFVRDYKCKQTQLINISSVGGYFLAPGVVPYCGTKFFVSAFTEGLYHELTQDADAKMQAKILAPAATKSEFCDVASGKSGFDYDASFEKYHSSEQTADFLLTLYDSDACVGEVDLTSFGFKLSGPKFNYLAAAK